MKKLIRYILSRIRGEEPTKRLIAKGLVVGKNFYRGKGVTIDSAHCWLIKLGDNVKLAPYVHILAHDAAPYQALGYTRVGLVEIGDNVQIGAHSIILPGVKIGNNVGIAAGSVVMRDIPDDSFVAGNPARRIGSINEKIASYAELLQQAPVYGEDYTLRGGITAEKKRKMIEDLQNGVIGFVK